MRHDVDPKKLTVYHATCFQKFDHPNAFGGVVEANEYQGFRHAEDDGRSFRCFISTRPGDLSVDWLDVTDYMQFFNFVLDPGKIVEPVEGGVRCR